MRKDDERRREIGRKVDRIYSRMVRLTLGVRSVRDLDLKAFCADFGELRDQIDEMLEWVKSISGDGVDK